MSNWNAVRRRYPGWKARKQFWLTALTILSLLRVSSVQWPSSPDPVWTPYATEVGGIERVVLPDGTSVELNTGSEIQTRVTAARREVVLTRGEAFFTVAHNAAQPFSVKAGGATVHAVGTRFSVRLRDDDEVDVLVTEGQVIIDGARRNSHAEFAGLQVSPGMRLVASSGESISLSAHAAPSRQKVSAVALKRKTAWIDGWLWFLKDPLPQAVEQFNRYHHEQIVLVDPALARLEVGGRFRSDDLGSFIAALEQSFNVRATPCPVSGTNASFIYLTERCDRAKQQCNWPMVQ
jgi:transmembrane sensor